MKKLAKLFFTLIITCNSINAQDHQSYDNYTGDWSNPATWEIGDGNLAPNSQTNIYGNITVNGNLNLNNGRDLDVYDTLVVTGNLTAICGLFGPYTDITVHAGGLLIILGDMTGAHSFADIDGDLIIVGEVDLGNWFFDPLDVTGHAYIFDDTPTITPSIPPNLEDENDIPPRLG
ncbi:hypothetical protein ES703_124197 [subsurface metagenome]